MHQRSNLMSESPLARESGIKACHYQIVGRNNHIDLIDSGVIAEALLDIYVNGQELARRA